MSENRFIPELIVNYLNNHGIDYITDLPSSIDTTVHDVVDYCIEISNRSSKETVDFNGMIKEALSSGYDMRYLSNIERTKERELCDFKKIFNSILMNMGEYNKLKDRRVIVVGIGDGTEGEIIYKDINQLTVIDIASESIATAKRKMPSAAAYNCSAEDLSFFDDKIFDAYVSLRTYQSTYFDITKSLKEAKRVLTDDGIIIISIACGQYKDGRYIYGLYNPHTGVLEPERPKLFVNIVKKNLESLDFKEIIEYSSNSEIFICCKR